MRADHLDDLIRRAYGRAAFTVGNRCHAYRSAGPADPLQPRYRFMQLHATFLSPRPDNDRPVGYGMATWWGVFDSAYTRPGDYIVREQTGTDRRASKEIWFIASQQPYLPVLCVRAPRVVSFTRPAATTTSGITDYGGYTSATANGLLTNFPASVLNADILGLDPTDLPSDAIPESWQVLLPAPPEAVLANGDLMSDDLGRSGVVSSAELSDLGWRLLVKQTTT
jgi:hypothetical protein